MITLLLKMKLVRERYNAADKAVLSQYYCDLFADEYARIVAVDDVEAPYNQKGKKQHKSRNLLSRFQSFQQQITTFVHNAEVPFDNNQAERDIRPNKVKQKVSGAFRSEKGIEDFATNASIIGTAIKHGFSVFDTIKDIVAGRFVGFCCKVAE